MAENTKREVPVSDYYYEIEPLVGFIKNGENEKAAEWIDSGSPVACSDPKRYAPLELCVRRNIYDLFNKLMAFDYSKRPEQLKRALGAAVKHKNVGFAKRLLDAGADMRAVWMYKLLDSSADMIELFLSRGFGIYDGHPKFNIFSSLQDERRKALSVLKFKAEHPEMEYLMAEHANKIVLEGKSVSKLRIWLELGVDPRRTYTSPDGKKEVCLIETAFCGANLDAVKAFRVSHDKDDMKKLAQKCFSMDRPFIEYLLDNGVEVCDKSNETSSFLRTCLRNCSISRRLPFLSDSPSILGNSTLYTAEWLVEKGAKLAPDDNESIKALRSCLAEEHEYTVFSFARKLLKTSSPDAVVKVFDATSIQRHLGMHLPEIVRRLRISRKSASSMRDEKYVLMVEADMPNDSERRGSDAIEIDRHTLYEELWASSMKEVCEKYRTTVTKLTNLCKRQNIPRPYRGYWTTSMFNRTMKDPLPFPDRNPKIFINPEPSGGNPAQRDAQSVPVSPGGKELSESPAIAVPEKLVAPHKLVQATAYEMEIAKTQDGLLVPPHPGNCLPMKVGTERLGRALRIFDAILKEADRRGLQYAIQHSYGDRWANALALKICGQDVSFRIAELQRKDAGKLSLSLTEYNPDGPRSWEDGRNGLLEDQLDSFFAAITAFAARKRDKELEEQRVARQKKEHDEKVKKFEALKSIEEKKLKDLMHEAARWVKSQQVRQYVEFIRNKASTTGHPVRTDEWLTEAMSFAERLDPTCPTPPSILDLQLDEGVFDSSWAEIQTIIETFLNNGTTQ